MEILFTKLADQPVLFLFLLIGVGMAFGHIKIKGIGLGAAAVLFLAIILSAWAETYASPESWAHLALRSSLSLSV